MLHTPKPHTGLRPSLLILVAVSAINPAGINIFIPSMASMEKVFNTDFATIQLTLSLYLAGVAVSQLLIGPLSDRFGRRPILLSGLSLFIVGSIVCSQATSIDMLIYGRLIQAFGGCAGIVLARAIVRDMYDREQAASMIGYVTMGMAVAPMVSPLVGGLLHEAYGWQASFHLLTVVTVVVVIWAWFALHETNPYIGRSSGAGALVRSYWILARVPAFWAYTLCAAMSAGLFFGFLGGAPYVSEHVLGLEPGEIGVYFLFVAGGYVIGNFLSGRFASRVGITRMIVTGLIAASSGVVIMTALFAFGLVHPLALYGPMLVIGVANGVALPSSVAGVVSVRPDLAGAASGLAGSLQVGLGALVSYLVAQAVTIGPMAGTVWPMIGVLAACAIAWAATVIWATATDKPG